jgi:hypothetical protein
MSSSMRMTGQSQNFFRANMNVTSSRSVSTVTSELAKKYGRGALAPLPYPQNRSQDRCAKMQDRTRAPVCLLAEYGILAQCFEGFAAPVP